MYISYYPTFISKLFGNFLIKRFRQDPTFHQALPKKLQFQRAEDKVCKATLYSYLLVSSFRLFLFWNFIHYSKNYPHSYRNYPPQALALDFPKTTYHLCMLPTSSAYAHAMSHMRDCLPSRSIKGAHVLSLSLFIHWSPFYILIHTPVVYYDTRKGITFSIHPFTERNNLLHPTSNGKE